MLKGLAIVIGSLIVLTVAMLAAMGVLSGDLGFLFN